MTSAACAARAFVLAHHDQRQGHTCTAFHSPDRTPTLAATKGPANGNQKNPLTEEENLARKKNHGPQAIVALAATGDANRRRRLAGSVRLTRPWYHLRSAQQPAKIYSTLQTAAAGWRANLIGPVHISKPPRASPSCIQSTHTQPRQVATNKRYDIRLVRPCFKQANTIFVLSRMVQMAQHRCSDHYCYNSTLLQTVRWLYHTPGLGSANHCLSQPSEESGSISRDHTFTSFSSALPSMLLQSNTKSLLSGDESNIVSIVVLIRPEGVASCLSIYHLA
ncbi:uncharacterized protein M437DRAFT_64515 [Aureobasidium melanogenum CBS 110374]|uniref:Uncharacterized protein n=1 Tax=Aureobasidium melanogenum (strain CBS 110374) TaxID=1043003 RepID=A0A074VWP5_AURM1|nr:uncharacterized protein M437DRAFT_64515 [Aureobasidium melanogenum CBS 110374]KEQ64898.1 hypothetical protein M437DRAFT_64515 [Aureobasidium melanogenum CBS 110374]